MAYRIEVRRIAQKQILSLPREAQLEVARVVDGLAQTPRPVGCKKLRETGLWRVRAGRYRAIYSIDDESQVVVVAKVATRREDTYKEP